MQVRQYVPKDKQVSQGLVHSWHILLELRY